MSQSDRAIKKLATQLARLDREVKSWRGAQADYTSIEAGTMDINDSDGNLVSRVGFQDDGSGAVRFFDGPIPPAPSGVTASADGPIIQATWDGTFQDGAEATYDLAYLEVAATQVDDASNVSFATITAKEGASASVVADVTGDWVVAVRSVSQAGKKSEFATAGTVEVKVTDVAGAIEAVQDSANGKNKVTYSSHAPTENDPGIFDDTWFVGQVGRPEDIIEATNLAENPSFGSLSSQVGAGAINPGTGVDMSLSTAWSTSGGESLKITPTASNNTTVVDGMTRDNPDTARWAGKTVTISADFHLDTPQTGSTWYNARRIVVRTVVGGVLDSNFAQSNTPSNVAGDQKVSVTFTLPTNLDSWYFMFVNGSSTTSVYWDSVLIQESSTSGDYFDGDTPSGVTDNESHYRWTGEPHASTSEKYLPALDIGESSNWNIIEQYRHDGTGWVKVELSHYVFSTVDLGKATVGELDGIRIMAKTISGDLFTGDAFDGIVFRGNTFTTRDGNGEFSDRGLFFQKPDGTAIFRVPTDGTPISMSASDVQIERAQVDELELNFGEVRTGGSLTLAAGVTPPASPPELNTGWQRVLSLPDPEERAETNGIDKWGDHWVRPVNVLGTREGDRIEIYDTDGTMTGSFPIGVDPRHGLAVIGDTVYVPGRDHDVSEDRGFVFGYDLNTGERVSRWELTNFYGGSEWKLAVSSRDGELLIAGVNSVPNLHVFRYNPATGAQLGQLGPVRWEGIRYTTDLQGVAWRGSDLYVMHRQATRVYTVSGGSLTRKPGSSNGTEWAGWQNPSMDGYGLAWAGDRPYVVDGSGVIREGSTFASDLPVEACFTWISGAYETTPSPVVTIGVPARESFTVSLPSRDGLRKVLYWRPAGGGWRIKNLAPDVTAMTVSSVGQVSLGGPPSSNSFPNSTPSTLRSGADGFEVKGDGSGYWGPLTFNANGSMSGVAESGQVVVTPTSANTVTSVEVTFPEDRYTVPPEVSITPYTGSPHQVSVGVWPVTATSFVLNVHSTTTDARRISWVAFDRGNI